ncbi:hypothetical protein G9A89_023037 [Geosiphon pyriformis]|nr:hypothetical protein G9A89_023037 [Geosiphon pyriformis]
MLSTVNGVKVSMRKGFIIPNFFNHSTFDRVLVFGDSYSDEGNVYRLTKGSWPLIELFWKGGYSNGPLWPWYLSQRLGGISYTSYAYGGATADNDLCQGKAGANWDIEVPGLKQQAKNFVDSVPRGTNLNNTLAVVWLVGNDYIFTDCKANPRNVVAHLVLTWVKLYQAGIRHFLLPTTFDISKLPYFKDSPAEFLEKLRSVTATETRLLKEETQKFKDDHQNAIVHSFDITKFWELLQVNMKNQDSSLNFKDACIILKSGKAVEICSDPRSHFYYDEFHPETKVHAAIAAAFSRVLY